jgi:protein involved in polysaccharide export with SLBB domain
MRGLKSPARTAPVLIGCLSATLLLGGCGNDYPPNLVPAVPSQDAEPALYRPTLEPDYIIAPGDGLQIQSYYDANLKQQAMVRTDGRISLLLLGDVMAAGKSPKDLGDDLAHQYSRILDRPDLTVSVTSSAGMTVYVGGEVKSPTQIAIKGELTVLQSITEAGGFLSTANKEQVLILRKTADGHFRTLQQNVEDVLKNQTGELYLQRHDIIYVPKTHIAQVDQFVDQYVNSIIPHSITGIFGYQYLNTSGSTTNSTTVVPP